MKKRILILSILFFAMILAKASLYRNYQTDAGLSHNSVWAVMQDSQGFMWFGTNDGLNRFDGLNFKVYRRMENDSLSIGSNFIHTLLESPNGDILVGTKEGLYLYNTETDDFTHISLNGESYGNDRTSVHCMFYDNHNQLWVGCYGQGIYCLDKNMNVIRHFSNKELPSRYVSAMTIDLAGAIWVGADNVGLFRLDPMTGNTSLTTLNDVNIQTMYRHTDNTLWIGTTGKGLFHYDPLSETFSQITDVMPANNPIHNIKSITPYGPNELVMGSEGGVLRLDISSRKLYSYNDGMSYDNLPDNSIFAITVDNEGALWLGTYFYGVCYRSPRVNAFSFYSELPADRRVSNDIVKSIRKAPDEKIMLTSINNGIGIFSPDTHERTQFTVKGLSKNIQDLLINGDEVWVSDYNRGIVVARYPSGEIINNFTTVSGLPTNIVNTIFRSSRGNIYAGSTRGAAILDGQKFKTLESIPPASVMAILEDYEGNLWFATHFNGLYRMNKEGQTVNYVNDPKNKNSLPGNNINCIFLDSRGILWIGSEGEGLAIFNPKTGKVERHFTESTGGLPSNIIYSIEEDEVGNLWVSTGGGLVKVSKEDYSIHRFRYIEKLLKINYTHNSSWFSNKNNKLYFGGSGGFVAFKPSEISDDDHSPKIHITDFFVNGQPSKYPTEMGKRIELEASESTFGFNVACLSYLSPEDNVVAYKLLGYDTEWKTLTGAERHIEYMNIPFGDYTLQIKGSNNDGCWSDLLEKDIVIHRPLLLSNTMLFVYLMITIGICFYIKRSITLSNRRKMLKFSHAKEKELYEAKIGFFTNIAHEIRTPLSLISAPLETILSSGDGSDRTRQNLVVMKSNVQRLLELINQLLDFRKVESQRMHLQLTTCDVSVIVEDICNRYEEFSKLSSIIIDREDIEKGIKCSIDIEAFKKIVGNLMSNALKFANKRIVINMRIDDTENGPVLRLSICDDGPGIKEKDLQRIFESFYQVDDHGKHPGTGLGLPLARSLARMHKGDVTVESEYGHGSKFILTIPTDLDSEKEISADTNENEADDSSEDKGKQTILVVEDNDQLRSFLSDNFRDTFSVLVASNGVEALALLEEKNIDIIISDIMMPDMDGIELCKAIRSNSAISHLPVILLSAKTDIETKVEGLNTGADAYMEKPFSVEQLRAQTNAILESRRRLRENFIKSPLDFYSRPNIEDKVESENADFVKKLNDLIIENMTNPEFSIDGLARMFCMSRSNFHKRVKGITGKTPNDYIRIIRLSKSAELLASGKYQIVEVCYMVGFNTPSYFSKCFAEYFGKLPKDYISELQSE